MENTTKKSSKKNSLGSIFYWASFFSFSNFIISLIRRNANIRYAIFNLQYYVQVDNIISLIGGIVSFIIFILIERRNENSNVCLKSIEFLFALFLAYNLFIGHLMMVLLIGIVAYLFKSKIEEEKNQTNDFK